MTFDSHRDSFINANRHLHACGGNPLVDAADNSEKGDACSADSEGSLRVHVALEGWQRLISLGDVHSLHNEQVVV